MRERGKGIKRKKKRERDRQRERDRERKRDARGQSDTQKPRDESSRTVCPRSLVYFYIFI